MKLSFSFIKICLISLFILKVFPWWKLQAYHKYGMGSRPAL